MIAWPYTFVKLIFRVYNIEYFNIYQTDKNAGDRHSCTHTLSLLREAPYSISCLFLPQTDPFHTGGGLFIQMIKQIIFLGGSFFPRSLTDLAAYLDHIF